MFFLSLKKQIVCAAAILLSAGAAGAAPYVVATDGTFAPFEFHDSKSNELVGFEIDLVRAMVAKMGGEVNIQEYKFDAIIPALISNSIDFAAAGFAVNPERAKRVLFTDSFYESGLTIVVPKGNPKGIKSFDDLAGKRISVQLGSVAHERVKKISNTEITTFEGAPDALLNMMSGNADAVVNSAPSTDYMMKTRPALQAKLERLNILEQPVPMAMAVPKSNPELAKKLSQALADIRADGTYNKIHEKWFGRPAE